MKGYCFGFEGPPGTGKTSFAKKGRGKGWRDQDGNTRPFAFIAVGGSSNASTLEGHSYTYVGSTWGQIVDILIETKCMNPIIYIDELDKISQTENGREIIGILTHLTDSTQNDQFTELEFL
jgi:ATP-dependent Lon protease